MLGYPGAGKTTTAKIIHELTGAEHLWADHIRREMYKLPSYTHQENMHLYSKLNEMTKQLLESGKSVIFDTNFNFYKDRQRLRDIASNKKAKTIIIWVQTPLNVAKQRATIDALLHANTRVLGNMPVEHFERISNNLEDPRPNEPHIVIKGEKISPEYVREQLQTNDIL